LPSAEVLGRAYEYLLRKFAEGQGQSAGEFYTPKEVGWLMAELLNPGPYSHVYDPTCGSAGLLIKTRLVYERNHPDEASKAPRLYGQELNPVTFAMAKMNMFLHDYTDSVFAIGDTFLNPGFGRLPGSNGKGSVRRFDFAVANPMWNQDNYDQEFYENDLWDRFKFGVPPNSSADWGWVQHIWSSLNDTGRAAIVLDTGAVSRGSGSKSSNKEREIRRAFVEVDVIESVILLPDNLFYNTTAPGIILLLNRNKPTDRKGKILIINASAYFTKEKPKNALTDEGIQHVVESYSEWKAVAKLSRVVTIEEVRTSDYNLSPSQFVETTDKRRHRLLSAILIDLEAARVQREEADSELALVLAKLGLIEPGRPTNP
jgi:type I restriction enzyme M protein